MFSKKILIPCLTVCFLTVSFLGAAEAKRKTRDLVFEDEEQVQEPAQSIPREVTVSTTIELTKQNGKISHVLPTHRFQSGDRVKIMYTSNSDAYVYWLSEGSSGDYYMLFPNPKVGMDNYVKKDVRYTIPSKGSFKFDNTPGTEKIILIMAPSRVAELDKAAREAAVKGGKVRDSSSSVNSVRNQNNSKRKTRDLVFEEESDENSGVSTNSQQTTDVNEPMVLLYELTHD